MTPKWTQMWNFRLEVIINIFSRNSELNWKAQKRVFLDKNTLSWVSTFKFGNWSNCYKGINEPLSNVSELKQFLNLRLFQAGVYSE